MTASVVDPGAGLPIGPEIDPAPARRPARETRLQGRHVSLVPVDPAAHTEPLFANAHGPDAEAQWLYLGKPPFADRAAFRAYLEAAALSDDPFMFTILDAAGEAVGHATFMRIEPAHRAIEVGNILFTPKLQRSPGATEAMYLMARHAFEDLGYRRYEWKCNALNAPSRRAAARLGFAYEGLFRDHMIVKGRSRDTAWFSMLAPEWPARRAAFERWLDSANFDEAGRQRARLSALNATAVPGDDGLRRAGPSDRDALEALQQAAYGPNRALLGAEPLPLLTPPAEILDRYEVWLAQEGDEIAGALVLKPRPDHVLIWSIATAPAHQRSGIGGRLLAAAEARARALGVNTLRLYTGEKLTRNVLWYHRHGYVIDRAEETDGRRLVHMIKTLEDQEDGGTSGG